MASRRHDESPWSVGKEIGSRHFLLVQPARIRVYRMQIDRSEIEPAGADNGDRNGEGKWAKQMRCLPLRRSTRALGRAGSPLAAAKALGKSVVDRFWRPGHRSISHRGNELSRGRSVTRNHFPLGEPRKWRGTRSRPSRTAQCASWD